MIKIDSSNSCKCNFVHNWNSLLTFELLKIKAYSSILELKIYHENNRWTEGSNHNISSLMVKYINS